MLSKGGFIKRQGDIFGRYDFPLYRIIEVTSAYGTKSFEVEKRVGDNFAWEPPFSWGSNIPFDSLREAKRWVRIQERDDRERIGVSRRVVG